MTTHISQLPTVSWMFAPALGAVFLMLILKLIFPGKSNPSDDDDSWTNSSDTPMDFPNDPTDTASNQSPDF